MVNTDKAMSAAQALEYMVKLAYQSRRTYIRIADRQARMVYVYDTPYVLILSPIIYSKSWSKWDYTLLVKDKDEAGESMLRRVGKLREARKALKPYIN